MEFFILGAQCDSDLDTVVVGNNLAMIQVELRVRSIGCRVQLNYDDGTG